MKIKYFQADKIIYARLLCQIQIIRFFFNIQFKTIKGLKSVIISSDDNES